MPTALLIVLAIAFIVGVAFLQTYLQDRVRTRALNKNMWDSRVEAWVAEGVSKGYCMRAGAHMAHDGRTKVHTLVVQTSAVKRLHEPTMKETHGR